MLASYIKQPQNKLSVLVINGRQNMIKVFGMARGGTNILCNMIYSFPEVTRPKYSELQYYIYRRNGYVSKIRRRLEFFLQTDQLDVDNYDADEKSGKKYKKIVDKLRDKNFLFKVMNGNIAYYDALNQQGDCNIILLRDKMSVLGSMIRRGAKPVKAINNINNFYSFAEFYSTRDNLLVIKFEDMLENYNRVLGQISEYLGYQKIDKVYLGLKGTLTNNRVGKKRIYINVSEVGDYIDNTINEKQVGQLESLCGKEISTMYKTMLTR